MQPEATAHPYECASNPGPGTENRGGLLLGRDIQDQLSWLVRGMSPNPSLYEDLMQEALVCFWRAQAANPGQTISWYKRRCRFHLQHLLGAGRSVDALKRGSSARPIDESKGYEPAAEDDIFQEICAQDECDELARHLDAAGQRTLHLLTEGLTLREVARELQISHVAVVHRRERIAAEAVSIGLHPS